MQTRKLIVTRKRSQQIDLKIIKIQFDRRFKKNSFNFIECKEDRKNFDLFQSFLLLRGYAANSYSLFQEEIENKRQQSMP